MTNAEIQRRKATMTEDQIVAVRAMIRQGYSDTAIVRECSARPTLKQVNAIFAEYRSASFDPASTGNVN